MNTDASDQSIARKRAKVLFFVGSMAAGGSETQLLEIIRRIDRSQFEPMLYLHHRNGELLSDVPRDVPIHSFWDNFSGTWKSKWHHSMGTTDRARWTHLAKCIEREDIDVVFNRNYLATLDAANACRVTGTSLVSACDADPIEEIQFHAQSGVDAETQAAKAAYQFADRVIAVSSGIRDRLHSELGIEKEHCEVLPNAIDVESALRLAAEKEIEMPTDRCNLLTVARISVEKGHQEFLKVLERLVMQHGCGDLLWHIVGTGPLEETLRENVLKRGLDQYVCFAGFQKNPYPYYQAADLFCLPSRHEAFGCVLTESLALGLPVVSTDCPSGPREILQDGKYGHLCPLDDVDAFSTAILDFRANRAEWVAQAACGTAHVKEHYSFDNFMPRLEQLLLHVIHQH